MNVATVPQDVRPRTRRSRAPIALAGLLLLALAVRVGYVLLTQNYVALHDAGSYDRIARTLADGHGWLYGKTAFRPPGYPFFLAGVYELIGTPHGTDRTAARLVQALLGTVTVALIGLLARQLWQDRRAMLVAVGIAAVYLPLLVVGEALMTEALFVPLLLGAVNCALASRKARHRWRWIVAAGVLGGLAALTRSNGILLAPALAALAYVGTPTRDGTPRGRARPIAAATLLLAVMALTIAPWTIRNAIEFNAFVPVSTEAGPTLAGTYNDLARHHHALWQPSGYHEYDSINSAQRHRRINEVQVDQEKRVAVARYIGHHPLYVAEVLYWNTARLLDLVGHRRWRDTAARDVNASHGVADATVYSFWVVGALALLGTVTVTVRRMRPRSLWLVPLTLWLSVTLVTTGTPRFRAALEPFFVVLAATALVAVWEVTAARVNAITRVPSTSNV